MSAVLRPLSVQKIGEELAIAWEDGSETYLGLEFLRKHCPCAACGGEPDVLGNIEHPRVGYTAESFQLVGYESVGGYGLQLVWQDGHRTGIYSYAYLKRLS